MELQDVLMVQAFEAFDLGRKQLLMKARLEHVHVDHLNGHSLARLIVLSLVHLTAKPFPDLISLTVRKVLDDLPSAVALNLGVFLLRVLHLFLVRVRRISGHLG